MYHDEEEWSKIWREIDVLFQNWHDKFDEFWPKHSKICTLMGSFWTKYIMFELENYWEVVFHDTEEWCKIGWKTDAWFGKWHEESGRKLKCLKYLHFNKLLLTKVYNVWAKNVQKSYFWRYWRLTKNVKKNLLVISKMTKNCKYWSENSKL